MHGRTIKILLDQGTPSGIRHAEVVNWTGQAVVCPRARVLELSAWTAEIDRPGVYLLLGKDDNTGRDVVYVGETENVRTRLQEHVKTSDFWHEAILFTSKDFNLTKSHVKYLESRLVQQVRDVKRARLSNTNTPTEPTLPRSDKWPRGVETRGRAQSQAGGRGRGRAGLKRRRASNPTMHELLQPGDEPACERVDFIDQRDHVIPRFPPTSANLDELDHWPTCTSIQR